MSKTQSSVTSNIKRVIYDLDKDNSRSSAHGHIVFVRSSIIPDDLAATIPTIRQWGIEDKEDRSEQIRQSTFQDLIHLVEDVHPYVSKLRNWLHIIENEEITEYYTIVSMLDAYGAALKMLRNQIFTALENEEKSAEITCYLKNVKFSKELVPPNLHEFLHLAHCSQVKGQKLLSRTKAHPICQMVAFA